MTSGSRLTKHGRVYLLELIGNTDHRLSLPLLNELSAHLETVNNSEDVGALVTTNEGKFFCNGLDLGYLEENPQDLGPVIYKKFEAILIAFMSVNVPTVAAVCGHAAGAGFAIAMAHDHRFMRADRGFLYAGGLDVKVAVPSASLTAMRSKMRPRVYRDTVLKCVKYTGNMALEAELVDGVLPDSAATVEAALKEAQSLAERKWDKKVYRETRLAMHPEVVEALKEGDYRTFGPVGADLKGFR